MSYYTLSIRGGQHDSAVTLMRDHNIVFSVSHERLSRKKRSPVIRPNDIIQQVARYTNKIDLLLTITMSPAETQSIIDVCNKHGISIAKHKEITQSEHHIYHAASGFYMSGFDDAVCIVVDGLGAHKNFPIKARGAPVNKQIIETTSIYHATYSNNFQPLYQRYRHFPFIYVPAAGEPTCWSVCNYLAKQFNYEVDIQSNIDLGTMFTAVSMFCGYTIEEGPGKIMGLAGYGKPNPLVPPMMSNHPLRSNMNLFAPEAILNTEIYPELLQLETIEQKADVAYALQRAFESAFIMLVEKALSKHNTTNIVVSGGCALNILANSVIKKTFPDINFFIDPIAHDASQTPGCAMYHYRQETGDITINKLTDLYLGFEYNVNAVSERLKNLVAEKIL